MQALISRNGFDEYLVEYEDDRDYRLSFKVYNVNSWYMDKTVSEKELYLEGSIKWDGDIHIHFGDDDGYLYICEKYELDCHKKIIDLLWEEAEKTIKNWDKELAY